VGGLGWLIHTETEKARTGETCRSCMSIWGTLLRTVGAKLRSFLEEAGFATAIAATGSPFNMSIKIR